MRLTKVKKIPLLLGMFLAFAPVYWTPWTGVLLTNVVKAALLALVFLISVISVYSAQALPVFRNKVIYLSVIGLLAITLFGVIHGDMNEVIYREESILLAFLFTECCYIVLLRSSLPDVVRYYTIFSVAVYVVWFIYAFFRPSESNPINTLLNVAETGFSGNRIQWSIAISMLLAWLLIGSDRFSLARILIAILGLAGQALVASRTGFAGTFVVLIVLAIRNFRLRRVPVIAAIVAGIVYYISYHADELRLATGGFTSLHGLNELSTGRISGYEKGFDLFALHPLMGNGIGNAHVHTNMGDLFVHNIVLRFAAEGGVFYALALVTFLVIALKYALLAFRSGNNYYAAAAAVIVIGVAGSMVEPEIPFGSFYINAMWWFALAVCLRCGYERNHMVSRVSRGQHATAWNQTVVESE